MRLFRSEAKMCNRFPRTESHRNRMHAYGLRAKMRENFCAS
jgi:hypothetical protein